MSDYKVKFEVFEGPLDLLLYLIKKEEVDIYEVNLTKLATQFIEYLNIMRMLDLDIAGEFLVMAATLMYIKSKELLPDDQQVKPENEEDETDPRWELIRQLVEYKKFKDAAAKLQELETAQENIYPKIGTRAGIETPPVTGRQEASIFDLISALNNVLQKLNKKLDENEIYDDEFTVSGKIEFIMNELSRKESLKFSELFKPDASKAEIVATFLALLELIRLNKLIALQTEEFGEIEIYRTQIEVVQSPQEPENTTDTSTDNTAQNVEQ